ncbi:hypothetical protein AAFC00_003587 [Neodothiora populina]|uniref:PinX1-related protein 1 n=1 Tax=Neodothiora populina TaxID=2781224 RepID=A0ABR3PEP8_9PEZI
MGLSAPKKRAKLSHDPNNTAWARNTESFGHKILSSQGWTPGQTLGASDAAHAEHYTAGSASHIRVLLKDDQLGLGAKRGGNNADTFGLSLFSGILGRLNGKTEEQVGKEQQAQRDVELALYQSRKGGYVNFVSAGFLVGDRIDKAEIVKKADLDEATKESVAAVASEDARGAKRKRAGGDGEEKTPLESDNDDNSDSSHSSDEEEEEETKPKAKKSKKSSKKEKTTEQEPPNTTTKPARKSKTTDPKTTNTTTTSDSDSEASSSHSSSNASEKKSSRKTTKKSKKESKKSSSTRKSASRPSTDDDESAAAKALKKAEKLARKAEREERRARKAARRAAKEAKRSASASTTASAGGAAATAAVAAAVPLIGRHAVRQRYIAAKGRAHMDPQALKEIFMVKA